MNKRNGELNQQALVALSAKEIKNIIDVSRTTPKTDDKKGEATAAPA